MNGEGAGLHLDRWFWTMLAAAYLVVLAVALWSPLLGAAAAVVVGAAALLATVIGTRRGTLLLGALLLATDLVLPGDLALQYRLPIGGGGIYILDLVLAILLVSVVLLTLTEGHPHAVESPVRLPVLLFLAWTVAGAVIGYLHGNDLKLVLQDFRSLLYYAVFFFAVLVVTERRQVLFMLRVLAVCLVLTFLIGGAYMAMGRGMVLDYVEAGVSRFPASDVVFLMGAVLLTTFVVVWPAGRRRPVWLWGLLFVALIGLVLSFVRGNWVSFVVGLVYLLVVLHVRERMRLVAGALVVAAVLAVGLAVLAPEVFFSVVTRASAVTATQDPSVQYRLIENREVGRQIAASPLVGNGLGKEYLFDWSQYGVQPFLKSYIHNNYYWFLQRLGIVGLVLFAWIAVAFLWPWMKQRRLLPRDDPWLVGTVYGGRAMVVALLASSVTSPRFNTFDSVTVIALVMGMSEVALALLRERGAREREAAELGGGQSAAAAPAGAAATGTAPTGAAARAALPPSRTP